MVDKIVADAVFDRIRELYGLASDAAMARHLGIYPQDVPRRREKGNVPFEAILTTCPPADWEYLFTGTRSAPTLDTDAALDLLHSKGYAVTLRKEGEG